MNIGVSTACFYPLITEEALKTVGKHNVKTTELFFNANCELEPHFIKLLKNIKNEYDMNIVSIHPTMSLAESFMLFSSYERRLEEGLDWYKRYSEIAADFGAQYIIMHGGKPNNVMDDKGYFERFALIAGKVKENGATLLQENVAKFRAGSLDFLKRMSAYLGETAKFCLDLKQCIRGNYSPYDVVDAVADNIKHLHISDSSNKNDCVLPGDGEFDFEKFFQAIKKAGYSGDAVIEVYSTCYNDYNEVFTSFDNMENTHFI